MRIREQMPLVVPSTLVTRAREYATLKHHETNHKYDNLPYDHHLNIVYFYALKYSHLLPFDIDKENVLAACWVHDVIEDCRQTYNDVKNILGARVADIAYALTNEKGKTRKERANEKYYKGIKSTPQADFVKICDRLANVHYSKETGSKMIDAYRKENEEFKKMLYRSSYDLMFQELEELLK